jgi:hypothetical protein
MANFLINHVNSETGEIKLDIFAGCDIEKVILDCLGILKLISKKQFITFDFNSLNVTIKQDSDSNLLLRDFFRALNGHITKNIGPYPIVDLDPEIIINEQSVNETKAKKQIIQSARAKILLVTKKAALFEELSPYPMSRDEEQWQAIYKVNSQDCYSFACVEYAELWARSLEKALAEGKTIPEVKDELERKVDECFGGITGYMHGRVVQILAKCWKYGDELRKIHNLETQIVNEGEKANESGGVLNSALLCITD